MNIYLDNGSTSYPKPKIVLDKMYDYMLNVGGNANRSNHSNSLESSRLLYSTRQKLCKFFNYDKVENAIFTNNITTALNYLILGSLKDGDHVITSSMEHNSVLRQLINLKNKGIIELTIIKGNTTGFISPIDIHDSIKNNTKLVVLSVCSNVTGSIQPIKEIGNICFSKGVFFIVDSAQGAGHFNIDIDDCKISALAWTGHKGLMGPQGIGGFIITDEFNEICDSIILGGTGSLSHSLDQPTYLPDKFESGTMNLPGIVGINTSLDFINSVSLEKIESKLNHLHKIFLDGLLELSSFKVFGELSGNNSSSIISFVHNSMDSSELAFLLEENGIKNRSGLHCAPLSHETIGTFPSGTVRLSIGYFNTEEEINYTLDILKKINNGLIF
ncbi:MAG: aminotransferase class V-fold PLP-dependent enzyme [Clostridium sp.]